MRSVILNFHGVGPVRRSIDRGENNCWLDQSYFEAVLDILRGQSHVQLTFDDGNASDVEIALPALLQHGLKATFFLCSGRLDQPTFLRHTEVRKLQENGMGIGSHGVNHLAWRHLPSAQLKEELELSKTTLEKICGSPIDRAACPFGSYDRHVLSGLRGAGYRTVYTSDGGISSEKQWLRARTTVTRSMPLTRIQHLVHQGPNVWTQSLIHARKFLKRLR